MIQFTVTLLEIRASGDGLSVADPGLSFDADHPSEARDRRVPRTQIAGDRQRHLGSPSQLRVDPGMEALHQLDMGNVANGVTVWIEPKDRLEAHCGAQPGNHEQAHLGRPAALDARHRWMRNAGRLGNGTLTEACGDPRFTEFRGRARQQPSRHAVGSIDRPVSGCHRANADALPLAGGYPGHEGLLNEPSDQRGRRSRAIPVRSVRRMNQIDQKRINSVDLVRLTNGTELSPVFASPLVRWLNQEWGDGG